MSFAVGLRARAVVVFVSLAVAVMGLPFQATPAAAISPNIVISQVYGGGGNSGAYFQNDFVELFNRGTSSISVAGWSIQYASATGTGTFGSAANTITPLSGSIAPGRYLLVQEASNAAVGLPLPTPNVTDTTPIAMAAAAGKVALVNTMTSLACNGSSTPCSPAALATIVDLVGYGTGSGGANFFEGLGAAPTLSATTAALRASGGASDTDDNSVDFVFGVPGPRNSTLIDAAPYVLAINPPGSLAVAFANVTVTFSEPVIVTGTWFTISCTSSGPHTATWSGGPTTFTLDPATDFLVGESCATTILAANVSDQDVAEPADLMAANQSATFTTVAPPASFTINQIQGAGHISPKNAQTVTTSGIVTAKTSNGFYLQDPVGDGLDATSEGIFVFTSSAPASVSVGDAATVSGTVSEFRPGGSSSGNLTTTEITAPAIGVTSHGNPLPAPILVGNGGRVPPSEIIENDATGNVETSGTFDPQNDGLDFWESLEGMRIQLNDAVAVGPTNSFGETPVVGDNGANASVRTARGGVLLRANDGNPERIVADDLLTPLPALNVGDRYDGPLVGVVDYNFGNFFLEVTQSVGRINGGLQRETATAPAANELAAATFNFENLDPTDPQSKFDRLATYIVQNLRSPDLIGGEEVQDNNGATDNGMVDASVTLGKLVAAIQAAGGPTYQWREIDPVNDQDGGEPGGNIRQVLLFRTDRGLSFVDRPGGTSTTPTGVTGSGASTQLTLSPGRIDPTEPNGAWDSSRKPLAGEFLYHGHTLFVIVNHFNSKGGDDPLSGRFQPPMASSEAQRHKQATIVGDFVAMLTQADPNANVIILGDLNDFEFSETVTILKNAGLHDFIETLPLDQRYSYEFEGNAQVLDHIMGSDAVLAHLVEFDAVHVNAEFADQASDHDPSVIRLRWDETAPVVTPPADSVVEATSPDGALVTFGDCTATDDVSTPPHIRISYSVPNGSLFPIATSDVICTATDEAGRSTTATFHVTVQDTTPPTISAPADQTAEATSPAGAIVIYPACTATDAASTPFITYSQDSGTQFALGPTTVTCTAEDDAGLQTPASFHVTVVDTKKPTISGVAAPAPNAALWNNTPVTVTFTCADYFLAACTDPVTLTGDGAGQSVSGTATDTSGNSASTTVGPINIDGTAPDVHYTGNAGSYTVDQTVSITCSASDTLSGLATSTCLNITGPASAFLGSNTYTATATDRAGNTSTATASFTVRVTFDSLCRLVDRVVTDTGLANSLCQKLANASAAEARGNHTAAQNILDAFKNEVSAQSGKAIPAATATLLRSLAAAF